MPMPYAPFRLTRAEYQRTSYFLLLPEGVGLEDVMKPGFWVHTKKMLRLHDVFELVAEDGTWEADIRCTSINQVTGDVSWRVIRQWTGEKAAKGKEVKAPAPDARFVVKSKGFGRFCVLEVASGQIIADGISKEEATATAERANAGDIVLAA